MTPLTKRDLDAAGCGTPGCKHDHSIIYLHSHCHPHKGVEVAYSKPRGILVVTCNVCERLVAEIRVGNEPLQ